MSTESQRPLVNGHPSGSTAKLGKAVDEFNSELEAAATDYQNKFHGDELLGDKQILPTGTLLDIRDVFTWSNAKQIWEVLSKMITGQGLDVSIPLCSAADMVSTVVTPVDLTGPQMVSGSQLVGSLPENSANRAAFIQSQVIAKYNRMLHPPLTYLGDAFQYRQSDGKFNVSHTFLPRRCLGRAYRLTQCNTPERSVPTLGSSWGTIREDSPVKDAYTRGATGSW